jgi:hypothetical protein
VLVAKKLILIAYVLMFFTFSEQAIYNQDPLVINQDAAQLSVLSSNRYTQEENDLREARNPYVTLDGYEFIVENDQIELYLKSEDLSFRVLNKETNYIWGSSFFLDYALLDEDDQPLYPDLYDEGDRGFRSQVWRNRVTSPLFIGYYTNVDTNPQFREESFFQSELSTFDLTILNQGFQANLRFGISQIQVSIVVTIDEEALIIEVPQDQIYDGPNAKLSRLSPYPFIGATKGDRIPGYIMIPDGIGALIRFEKESLFTNVYEKPFYGFDVGTARNIVERTGFVRAEQGLFASVYGMVHGINQHAFLSHIEQGSPYASLVVYPANLTTDFFWTFVNYQYRNVYRQPLNQSQSNAIVQTYKKNLIQFIYVKNIFSLSNRRCKLCRYGKHLSKYFKTKRIHSGEPLEAR